MARLKTQYQIKATNKVTGEQYVLGFYDEHERDDALAILREYGLAAFLKGIGNFEPVK